MRRSVTVVVICALGLLMSGCSSSRSDLDFSLTNLTGAPLKFVYLSPSTSNGWEENIVAGSELKSGETIKVRFKPNERAVTWDLRIEGTDGRYAELKELKLIDISEIRLLLERSPQLRVVAEIE